MYLELCMNFPSYPIRERRANILVCTYVAAEARLAMFIAIAVAAAAAATDRGCGGGGSSVDNVGRRVKCHLRKKLH